MFTPSIILLMLMNTVAAGAAAFVAFQASALVSDNGLPPATASSPQVTGPADGELAQESELADAA